MHGGLYEPKPEDGVPMNPAEARSCLKALGVDLKESTLKTYRSLRIGPKFFWDAGHPRYIESWLREYAASRRQLPAPRAPKRIGRSYAA